ncbi:MAG: hypothetical protein JJU11_10745 [Candidatus Sumerlaeia bacterium]|nr:hypothetical protein [Candidatus Sumerlaeia bacterium]
MTILRHLICPIFLLAIAVTPVAADNDEKSKSRETPRMEQSDRSQRGGWKRGGAPERNTPNSFGWTARFVGEMGREIQRIRELEEGLERHQERLRDADNQRRKARHARMLEIRGELLELEKEDFTERFWDGIGRGLKKMEEELKEDGLDDLPSQTRARLQRFHERLAEYHEQSGDFESIREYYREQLAAMREQMHDSTEREDLRRERLNREIDMLRYRLGRLQGEMERLGEKDSDTQEDE